MKLLIVVDYYIPHLGGVEIVVKELSERLVRQGHEVHIVTAKLPNSTKYEEINGVKVHRVSVPSNYGRYWFNTIYSLPKILEIGRKCDIIHAACYNSAFPAWVGSFFLRKKRTITIHEPLGNMWKSVMGYNTCLGNLLRLSEKMLLSLPFDKHICVSRYSRNCLRFLGIPDEKLVMIYNGIDNELFNPLKTNRKRIRNLLNINNDFIYMYFGRPGVTKGLNYLIKAVPVISKAIPNSRFLLILSNDPGVIYDNILNLIRELNIKDRIILLDPVDRNELPHYISAADCVIVPSLSEGFGFSAAEACALDRPLVSTDVGSLPEVISGRYILIPPRDYMAIKWGVEMVYKNEVIESEKKLFSWDNMVNEYIKIYNILLSN